MSDQAADIISYIVTLVVILWAAAMIGSTIDSLTKAVRELKDGE